jgi:hypothetical protein
VVLSKRRFTYEAEVATNPLNYDAWLDYIKLEESAGDVDRVREVRVVLCVVCLVCRLWTECVLGSVRVNQAGGVGGRRRV